MPEHRTGGIRACGLHELSQWIKIRQFPVLNNSVLMCSENAETVSATHSACLSPKVGWYGKDILALNLNAKATDKHPRKSQCFMGKQSGLWSLRLTKGPLAFSFQEELVCLFAFLYLKKTRSDAFMLRSDVQIDDLSLLKGVPFSHQTHSGIWEVTEGNLGFESSSSKHPPSHLFPEQYGSGTL